MSAEYACNGVGATATPPPPPDAGENGMPPRNKKKRSKRFCPLPPPPPDPADSSPGSLAAPDEGDAKRRRLPVDGADREVAALALIMLARGMLTGRGAPAHRDHPDMPPLTPAIRSYECSQCGKSFLSPQALGGHKTIHRKEAGGVIAAFASSTGGRAALVAAEEKKQHRCQRCQRSFPTGQALGGHMKHHYEEGSAAKEEEKEEKAAASSSVGVKEGKDRGFDLNIPALPEEPENFVRERRPIN